MPENADARRTNQPQDSADWRSPNAQRHSDNQKTSVKLGGGSAREADVEIGASQLADAEHSTDDEGDDEQQQQVGQQAVDAEHDEDDGIVAAEVGEVVVDAGLDLAEVLRLGQALEVEEFADGLEVGEAAADALGSHAVEAALQVEAAGQSLDGDVHAGHVGWDWWCGAMSVGGSLLRQGRKASAGERGFRSVLVVERVSWVSRVESLFHVCFSNSLW